MHTDELKTGNYIMTRTDWSMTQGDQIMVMRGTAMTLLGGMGREENEASLTRDYSSAKRDKAAPRCTCGHGTSWRAIQLVSR